MTGTSSQQRQAAVNFDVSPKRTENVKEKLLDVKFSIYTLLQ